MAAGEAQRASAAPRTAVVVLGLAILALAVTSCAGLVYWRHQVFVAGLVDYAELTRADHVEPQFPLLSRRDVVDLGWAHRPGQHPAGSYLTTPREKPAGTLRIGVFGDSFVYGSEVEGGRDFPRLLQRKLARVSEEPVTVVNFGAAAYGVHQSFLLWQRVGRDFDLDYTIFVPFDFHLERDDTFVFSNQKGPIHARYIVSEGELELVPVAGESRPDAVRSYFGLIPRWRYLRYDRKGPAVLRALLPAGFQTNPFYQAFFRDDVLTSYELILGEVAEGSWNLIVPCIRGASVCSLADRPGAEAAHFLEMQAYDFLLPSLYRAPGDHLSALGNELIAAELAAFLTGEAAPALHVIQLRDDPSLFAAGPGPEPPGTEPIALNRATQVWVELAGRPAADFAIPDEQTAWEHVVAGFAGGPVESLLVTFEGRGPLRDLRFVPVAFPLEDGAPVSLRLLADAGPVEIPLGHVEASGPLVARVALAEAPFEAVGPSGVRVGLRGDDWLGGLQLEGGDAHPAATLSIAGRPVLAAGPGEGALQLVPIVAPFVRLRAPATRILRIDEVRPRRGSLDLVVQTERGEYRQAIAGYRVVSAPTTAFAAPFARVIPIRARRRPARAIPPAARSGRTRGTPAE